MTEAEADKPLAGTVVVDLTTALAGPYATLLLAGLGARVIKVENPRGGDVARNNSPFAGAAGVHLQRKRDDDLSLAMLERGRGKQSVTLDLKHPRATEVFAALVRRADVVVENYAAGTADRLGIGYGFAQAANPRIIYCSISGFGAAGVGRSGKAMDTIIQALSGVMRTAGVDEPQSVRLGVPFGDLTAPLFAVIGIQAALWQRERTGRGQSIDTSLLGALTSMVAIEPFDVMEAAGIPMKTGRTMARLAPFGIFAARDGDVAICAPTDAFAHALFEVMGAAELADDPRYGTRSQRVMHAAPLHGLIDRWVAGLTREEVVERLSAAGVPAAEVRGPGEAVVDPRVVSRQETVPLSHPIYGEVPSLRGSGVPIRLSDSKVGHDGAVPFLGQHNREVYGQLCGYDARTMAELERDGVI